MAETVGVNPILCAVTGDQRRAILGEGDTCPSKYILGARNLGKPSFGWEARALPGANVPAGEAGGNSAWQRP